MKAETNYIYGSALRDTLGAWFGFLGRKEVCDNRMDGVKASSQSSKGSSGSHVLQWSTLR